MAVQGALRAALCLGLLCSIALATEPPARVVVGLLAPTERRAADSLRVGAQLGLELAERTCSVKTSLAVRGHSGQWGAESDDAAALALDENVDGMITPPGGSGAHQVLQVAGRTRIAVVSLCPDSSVTRAGVPWAVRIVPSAIQEAAAIFASQRRADGSQAVRTWAALVPPDRAGREAAHDLSLAAKEADCSLSAPLPLPARTEDWNTPLDALVASAPGAVLLWLEPADAGQAARELRTRGFHGLLAGPSWLDSPSFAASIGPAPGRILLASAVRSEDAHGRWKEFAEAYRRQAGYAPDARALYAHDAALVLVQALRRAGASPRVFEHLDPVLGASGWIQFDESGNRIMTLQTRYYEIQNSPR